MNPRDFCRARSYETAVALTYSFDALFFERLVLPDLWAGGAGEVLVIADPQQLDSAIPRVVGQVRHLGRNYRLLAATSRGIQHAKLFLRVGAGGALLWVGSGNLTFGGWGANRELATAWRVEPGNVGGAATTRRLLEAVAGLVNAEAADVITRALDIAWIATAPETAESDLAVLMSGPNATLASQLERRWAGRRFHRVRILTGSTDKEGAFLAWAARIFGVTEAVVGVDPALSDFDPARIEVLPLDVRILPLPADPKPHHAKMVFFEGPDGCAALVGSANCSAAAWIVPLEKGGNVEIIVAFDSCTETEFSTSLKPFADGIGRHPRDVLTRARQGQDTVKPPPAGELIRLVELSVSEGLGQLSAAVDPPLGHPENVEAEFAGLRMRLERVDPEGRRWVGPAPDLPPGISTRFGRLLIRYVDRTIESTPRWLDEHDQLRHASRGRRSASVVPGLAQAMKTPEQRKLLEDLASVATGLFSDWSGFPDPPLPRESRPQHVSKAPPPVDPNELVRRLADLETPQTFRLGKSPTPGLPLLGVLRVLFPDPPEPEEGDTGDEAMSEPEGPDAPTEYPPVKVLAPRAAPPPESLRKKLVEHISLFLQKLSEPEFAQRCTATQLVQATAFPLAVAAKGLAGSWIDQDTAALWVVRTCDLLLRTEIEPGAAESGLLATVRRRYTSEDRDQTFQKVVGDGTLWVALAAALVQVDWKGMSRGLDRALALHQVFEEPALYATAEVGRLGHLLARHGDARAAVLVDAPTAAYAVRQVARILAENFAALKILPSSGVHRVGDPLWHPWAGFARVEEKSPNSDPTTLRVYLHKRGRIVTVLANHYLNVRLAAESSQEIAKALSLLAPCWPGHTASTHRSEAR